MTRPTPRGIETLDCSEEFWLLNFQERKRDAVTGKNTVQEYRVIEMTKDGFTFLVMGCRGQELFPLPVVPKPTLVSSR